MSFTSTIARLAAAAGVAVALVPVAGADDATFKAVENDDGKHFTADGVPTFFVEEDGTVDWYTFSGFRRYHAECHVCHGPDGEGSSYAPALKESAVRLDYADFLAAIAGGIKRVGAAENQVMPAFGMNPNVMCYVDDIYIYLRARGAEAVPRGRPAKKAKKPQSFVEAENACMG